MTRSLLWISFLLIAFNSSSSSCFAQKGIELSFDTGFTQAVGDFAAPQDSLLLGSGLFLSPEILFRIKNFRSGLELSYNRYGINRTQLDELLSNTSGNFQAVEPYGKTLGVFFNNGFLLGKKWYQFGLDLGIGVNRFDYTDFAFVVEDDTLLANYDSNPLAGLPANPINWMPSAQVKMTHHLYVTDRLSVNFKGRFRFLNQQITQRRAVNENGVLYSNSNFSQLLDVGASVGLNYFIGKSPRTKTSFEKESGVYPDFKKHTFRPWVQSLDIVLTADAKRKAMNLHLSPLATKNEAIFDCKYIDKKADKSWDYLLNINTAQLSNFTVDVKSKNEIHIDYKSESDSIDLFDNSSPFILKGVIYDPKSEMLECFDGTIIYPDGKELQFSSLSDPVPLLLVVAAVAAGGALLYSMSGDEDIDCKELLLESIKNCERKDGIAEFKTISKSQCEFNCRPKL